MNSSIDLLNGPIDSSLRKFAFPLAFSFLISMAYSWVDAYYVSMLGSLEVAAIGVSEHLVFFVFTIGSGFAIGSGIIIARRYGQGSRDEGNRIATQSLGLIFVIGVLLAAMLIIALPYILDLMGIKGEVNKYAGEYLDAVLIGLPGNFMMFQISSFVRSSGNSTFPMYLLVFSVIANAVIAPFLIFGIGPFPRLEIAGAGYATAAAQYLGAIAGLIGLRMNMTPVRIVIRNFRLDLGIIKQITKLGVPSTFLFMIMSINRLVLTKFAALFGDNVLTAYTIGLRLDLFMFMSIFATGIAIEVTTSQNIGANQMPRVFNYYWSAVRQLSLLMLILGVAVFFWGENFARIFTEVPEIIRETGDYLRITSLSYIPYAIGIISIRALNGTGDTKRSILLALSVLLLIQVPLVYLLSGPFSFAQDGIWMGITVSYILYAVLGIRMFGSRKWLKVKV